MDTYLEVSPRATQLDTDVVRRGWLDVGTHATMLFATAFWIFLWLLRGRWDDTRKQDLYIFISALAWQNHYTLRTIFIPILQLPASRSLLTLIICVIAARVLSNILRANDDEGAPQGAAPWLLPSRTSHTRLFPKKHSFAYSLLQVAIRVDSHGRFGSLVSIGDDVKRKGWFHVSASDYLSRNSTDATLESKLRTYLRSQGVDDASWIHAYLITAPRFLGYVFNPVSFLYIYSAQDVLTMMILEVNNTFDERRMYLLRAKDPDEKSEDGRNSPPPTAGDEFEEKHIPGTVKDVPHDGKFRKAWTKDFHVSPFNSRKGYYTLTATDPFGSASETSESNGPIFNNTITLKSSKDHVKLTARIFSHGTPINALTASWMEMIKFVLTWFWVGFLTFPRILREAAVLFWRRGLHVWLRPEVLATSIGRREEKIEADLAHYFGAYLKHLVEQCSFPLRVTYDANLKGTSPTTFTSCDFSEDNGSATAETLDIRVRSPVFFARFMHYAHTSEAFDRECIFTDEKNRTVWLSRPDLMHKLLKAAPAQNTRPASSHDSAWSRFKWAIHRLIRCHPAAPTHPSGPNAANMRVEDIRSSTFSEMDWFVMAHMGAHDAAHYRRLCARLFLAQSLAFGIVPVIDFFDFALRIWLGWIAAESVTSMGDGVALSRLASVSGSYVWALLKT